MSPASRVSYFLNKFRKPGLTICNGKIEVHRFAERHSAGSEKQIRWSMLTTMRDTILERLPTTEVVKAC